MNRKILILTTVAITFILIAFDSLYLPAISHNMGADAGFAHDPQGGNATCNSNACHAGPAVAMPTGIITTTIPPTGYIPGDTFNISATVARDGHVRFGFEITAQDSLGNYLGTIIDTSMDTQLTNLNTHYITHTIGGTSGTNTKTWAFNWKAPVVGSGKVTFYGCFNIANNNGNQTGDTIICSSTTVIENINTGIMTPKPTADATKIFPNPCSQSLNIILPAATTSPNLFIYTLTGKAMLLPAEMTSSTARQSIFSINTSTLPDGIYNYKIIEASKTIAIGKFVVNH